MSSSAETENSVIFRSPQGPFKSSPVYGLLSYNSPTTKHEDTPVRILCVLCRVPNSAVSHLCLHGVQTFLIQAFLKGVDAVKLANAKLQPDAGTTALKLMDCVFSTSEMVNGNPSGVTRSKDEIRQRTIQALDAQKMRFIVCRFEMFLLECSQCVI